MQKEVTTVAAGVTVRWFRGMNALVLPTSATDISPEFAPILVPLRDPADFGHDVEYALTLRRKRCWFFDHTSRAIYEAFKAKEYRNVGTIQYAFIAVAGNQKITGTTVLALFVRGK